MSIDTDQLKTHLDNARQAIGNSDWSLAETELLQAQTVLAGMPDGSDGGGNSVSWRQTIEQLMMRVRQAKAKKTGVQRSKVKYTRVES